MIWIRIFGFGFDLNKVFSLGLGLGFDLNKKNCRRIGFGFDLNKFHSPGFGLGFDLHKKIFVDLDLDLICISGFEPNLAISSLGVIKAERSYYHSKKSLSYPSNFYNSVMLK